MKSLSLTFAMVLLLLAGCVSTDAGDTSSPDISNIDEIPFAEDGGQIGGAELGNKIRYDPLLVRDLIEKFLNGNDDERIAIESDLVSIGRRVIPHIARAQQKIKDQNMVLRLMRITAQIEEAAELANPDPDESNPDEIGTPRDPKENNPEKVENGTLPPSVTDTAKAAADLVDVGFDVEEVNNFIYNRLNAAYRAFERKDFDRTIELCQAIVTLAPHTRYRKEVLHLLLDAQSGELSDRHLAGTIGFDRKFERFSKELDGSLDRALTLSVFLTNVGRNDVTIDFGGGGEGDSSILVLDMTLTEESATDSALTRGRISLPMVGEEVRLAPGESHRFSIEVSDFSGLSLGGGVKQLISRVNAFGSVRPAKFVVHKGDDTEERVFRPILLSTDEIIVMPAGFELAVAKRAPIAFMRKNLDVLNASALHMVIPFLESKDFKEALNLLLGDDLRTIGNREREARLSLAARITKRPFSLKIEDWIEWWRDNRFRY